jgi:hypothetical protein
LAEGRLPAKQIANVVVSLARQKHLSPPLAAAARDLLVNQLDSCNGQDVSQILFGLMLDKHSLSDALQTFQLIASALARHLRRDETFQAQAVSRILSSYAKVGCYSPAIFEAGVRRLAPHLGELKPAFVAELATALAAAGHADTAFMRQIGTTIKKRFHDYPPGLLCSSLWAFAQSRTFHADLFNLACSKLANLVSRGQLPHQDVTQARLHVLRKCLAFVCHLACYSMGLVACGLVSWRFGGFSRSAEASSFYYVSVTVVTCAACLDLFRTNPVRPFLRSHPFDQRPASVDHKPQRHECPI